MLASFLGEFAQFYECLIIFNQSLFWHNQFHPLPPFAFLRFFGEKDLLFRASIMCNGKTSNIFMHMIENWFQGLIIVSGRDTNAKLTGLQITRPSTETSGLFAFSVSKC